MDTSTSNGPKTRLAPWAFACFLVLVVVLLFTEHRAHTLGALFWLLVFACPLMHFFMHRGHGAHGDGPGSKPTAEEGHSHDA